MHINILANLANVGFVLGSIPAEPLGFFGDLMLNSGGFFVRCFRRGGLDN